jgi:hypothetical protein
VQAHCREKLSTQFIVPIIREIQFLHYVSRL